MVSSYSKNNIGKIIYNTILAFSPGIAVELGVLQGYSAYYIASAFKFLDLQNTTLDAYDLWDDYPYNHGDMNSVQKMLDLSNLSKFVKLYKEDAYVVHDKYRDLSVDFLHIDISNNGDIFNYMIEKWTPKLRHRGILMFEGGSEERDQIDWMIKYDKKLIRPEINSNKIFNENYIYGTYSCFPSITIAKKVTR